MTEELSLMEIKKEWHGSFQAYTIGFFASLLLTMTSFLIVAMKLLVGSSLIFTLVGLAIIQAFVQLFFFLHLGKEEKPRWESLTFCFMVLMVLIIALGSLWIMYDLNNRVMMGMSHD